MKNGRSGRYAAAVLVVSALVAACMSPPLRAFESLPDALYLKSGAQTSLEFTLPGSALITSDSAAVISSLDQSVGSMGNTVTLTAGDAAGEATLVYRLLGLISYLTAGPKEVRAWTITEGTKAPGAAGKIHTDFERGFIRAEVVGFDTLMEKGSFNAAKEAGLVRSEGKDYVVRDGDVVLFRFNV